MVNEKSVIFALEYYFILSFFSYRCNDINNPVFITVVFSGLVYLLRFSSIKMITFVKYYPA